MDCIEEDLQTVEVTNWKYLARYREARRNITEKAPPRVVTLNDDDYDDDDKTL